MKLPVQHLKDFEPNVKKFYSNYLTFIAGVYFLRRGSCQPIVQKCPNFDVDRRRRQTPLLGRPARVFPGVALPGNEVPAGSPGLICCDCPGQSLQ